MYGCGYLTIQPHLSHTTKRTLHLFLPSPTPPTPEEPTRLASSTLAEARTVPVPVPLEKHNRTPDTFEDNIRFPFSVRLGSIYTSPFLGFICYFADATRLPWAITCLNYPACYQRESFSFTAYAFSEFLFLEYMRKRDLLVANQGSPPDNT